MGGSIHSASVHPRNGSSSSVEDAGVSFVSVQSMLASLQAGMNRRRCCVLVSVHMRSMPTYGITVVVLRRANRRMMVVVTKDMEKENWRRVAVMMKEENMTLRGRKSVEPNELPHNKRRRNSLKMNVRIIVVIEGN